MAYNPERAWQYSLKTKYGITPDQYKELLSQQEGKCAICEKEAADLDVKLAVDHDHKSGEIRGLLCRYCNHRVVGRHRDGDLLRKMADYVERHTGWFVPPKKRKKRGKRNT